MKFNEFLTDWTDKTINELIWKKNNLYKNEMKRRETAECNLDKWDLNEPKKSWISWVFVGDWECIVWTILLYQDKQCVGGCAVWYVCVCVYVEDKEAQFYLIVSKIIKFILMTHIHLKTKSLSL